MELQPPPPVLMPSLQVSAVEASLSSTSIPTVSLLSTSHLTGPPEKDSSTKNCNTSFDSGTYKSFPMHTPVGELQDFKFDGSEYFGCHEKNSVASSAPNPSDFHASIASAPNQIAEVRKEGADADDYTTDCALQSVAPVLKRKLSPATELENCATGQKQKPVSATNHPPAPSQAHYPYGHYPHPPYPYYYPFYPPHASAPHGYAWPPYPPPHHAYPHYYPGYYPHPNAGKPVSSEAIKKKSVRKTSSKHKRKTELKRKTPMLSMHRSTVKPLPVSSSASFPLGITVSHDNQDFSFSEERKDDQLPSSVPERRSRKNAQSRMRAAKLKDTIRRMKKKNCEERTTEENEKLATYEERRMRKNGRSRDRAMERKRRFGIISAKSENEWNEEEKLFMTDTLVSKYKKNEGDRIRRKKMRDCDYSIGSSTVGSYSPNEHPKYFSSTTLHPRQLPQNGNVPEQVTSCSRALVVATSAPPLAPLVASAPPLTPKSPHQFYHEEGFGPNMFDVTTPKNDAAEDYDFMSNFIFPSPSQDNDAYFNSPTLELCAETSILDQNLDEIVYSPRAATPRNANQNMFDAHGQNQVTLPLATLCPLDLPRRSKPDDNLYDALASDWKGIGEDDMGAIAVSFSMEDTM